MVPLRGYGNIFSHLFQCHHESSISTPFNIYPIHLINVSILVANATIKKENVSKRKKFCYSDGTHFLLLTFSVHFVVRKRMLMLNATSLFFYRVISIDFTFFFFQCTMSTFYKKPSTFHQIIDKLIRHFSFFIFLKKAMAIQ